MLYIHYYSSLSQVVKPIALYLQSPRDNLFLADKIIIPEHGIGVFLSQQIAVSNGIIANIQWQKPTQLMNQLAHIIFPDKNKILVLEESVLFWQIMTLLPQILTHSLSKQLRDYLKNDPKGLKKYQLCQRISESFQRYQIFRPAWLNKWENNPAEHWQALLWKILKKQPNTIFLIDFIKKLVQPDTLITPFTYPLTFVGFSHLNPIEIAIIKKLALFTDITLYFFNPTRQQLEKNGNALFLSLAHPARIVVNSFNHTANFLVYKNKRVPISILKKVQTDIVQNKNPTDKTTTFSSSDVSIQIHACHSPLREIEVLHNQLLALFEQYPQLKPHDIIVMTPNIESYAPVINAVFSSAPEQRKIPWKIADYIAPTENTLIQTFLSLLQLPRYRLTNAEVLNWLSCPAILRCFNLDETALENINQWVEESNIRWGLDQKHKKILNLPENHTHTWKFGLQRLFMGYALPTDNKYFNHIAPYSHIEGNQSIILGQLAEYITRLQYWHEELSIEADTEKWFKRMTKFLNDFFVSNHEDAATFSQIQHLLTQLCHHFSGKLTYSMITSWFKQGLQQNETNRGFLKSGVTFCELKPKRVISKSVIALLGMNDGDFPHQTKLASFDLIVADKQPTQQDVDQRDIDRQLFLENLMAAEDTFYLSYIGKNQCDNSEKIPTVIVAELLDYLTQYYHFSPVIHHPLQAFSHRYFTTKENNLFSYTKEWLKQDVVTEKIKPADLVLETEGTEEIIDEISLDKLTKFYIHPIKYFCNNQLALVLEASQQQWQEDEPFSINNLQKYFLKTDLLQAFLAEKETINPFAIYQQWKSEGKLPDSGFGEIVFNDCETEVFELAKTVKEAINQPLKPIKIELKLENITLTGWLENIYQSGLVRYRTGKIRPQDELTLWIEHLLLTIFKPESCEGRSQFIGQKTCFVLNPLQKPQAHQYLNDLVNIFLRGQQQVLPIFINSSYEYAQRVASPSKRKNTLSPVAAAWSKWHGSDYGNFNQGEKKDVYHEFIFRHFDIKDILNQEFEHLAIMIFQPICEAKK